MILGDRITFLIGGGCDPLTEYVELIVDGYPVARATGKCTEAMKKEVSCLGWVKGTFVLFLSSRTYLRYFCRYFIRSGTFHCI